MKGPALFQGEIICLQMYKEYKIMLLCMWESQIKKTLIVRRENAFFKFHPFFRFVYHAYCLP